MVKVYTPKGLVLEKSTEYLKLPGESGDIGVFYDHTPSLVQCVGGDVMLKTSNHVHGFFLTDSLAYISKDTVVILADYVEPVETIDRARAESSKERALKRLADSRMATTTVASDEDVDVVRAKRSLHRAQQRLDMLTSYQIQ